MTTASSTDLEARLLRAHRSGRRCDLPGQVLDLEVEDAYDLQDSVVTQLVRETGTPVVGYKIGVTSAEAQATVGASEPTYGQLLGRDLRPSGARLALEEVAQARIEPELLFVARVDLSPDMDRAELAASLDVVPCLEIAVSRFDDWFPHGRPPRLNHAGFVADNAVAGFVVRGTGQVAWSHPSPEVSVDVRGDGASVARGSSTAVLGDPLTAVAWLVRRVAGRGRTVTASSLISAGTMTAPLLPERGRLVADYSHGLGTVEVEIT